MFRFCVHYGFHFIIPFLVLWFVYKKNWVEVIALIGFSMLIDLDHLLAEPIFDPTRCSIGFHPLHSVVALLLYAIFLIPKKTRLWALLLIWHLVTDKIDCWMLTNL